MNIKGGDKFERELAELARKLAKPASLRVGFLQGATYPDGKPVAMIAAIQEYGAPGAGIPPRPFFRNMIAEKSSEWPKGVGDLLVATKGDVEQTLEVTGAAIAGQLRQSIIDLWEPPLAPSTIARKGFDKPLIDTGHMLKSIDHEVTTE
jgi:hypothetical protein